MLTYTNLCFLKTYTNLYILIPLQPYTLVCIRAPMRGYACMHLYTIMQTVVSIRCYASVLYACLYKIMRTAQLYHLMHPALCIFFETSLMHGYTAICKKPFVKELPLNLLKNYPYPRNAGVGSDPSTPCGGRGGGALPPLDTHCA